MPYDLPAAPNPMGDLAALAGMVGAYFAEGPKRKQEQEAAAQQAELQKSQIEEATIRGVTELSAAGMQRDPKDPNKFIPITRAAITFPKGATNAQKAGILRDAAIQAEQAGQTDYAKSLRDDAGGYETGAYRESQTAYEQAGVPLRQSQVRYNDAKTRNVQGQFAHDLQMIQARGVSAAAVAHIRAAYRGAGGGRGNSAAVESRALDAALNAAAREGVNAHNALNDSIYRYQSDLHLKDPVDYPQAPPPPQVMPIPVYGGGGTTQVYVLPNGQVVHPQPAGRTPTKKVVTPKAITPPPQTGAQPSLLDRIHTWFTGAPASHPPPTMSMPDGTKRYLHSDGLYYPKPQ